METPRYKRPRTESGWTQSGAIRVLYDDEARGRNEGQVSRSHVNLSFGRPIPMNKVEAMTTQNLRFRLTNMGQFSKADKTAIIKSGAGNCTLAGLSGHYPLVNHVIGGLSRFPLWCCSLTQSCAQLNAAATDVNRKALHGHPVITNTGEIRWYVPGDGTGQNDQSLYTVTEDGSRTRNYWQAFDTAQSGPVGAVNTVGARAMLNNSHITLHLYGQKNYPTQYRVMLVQFDEDTVPIFDNSVDVTTADLAAGYDTRTSSGVFWLNWWRKIAFNPDSKSVQGNTTGMRVLYNRYIDLEPGDNNDNDTAPHMHRMRLNIDWYRRLNYRWEITESGITAGGAAPTAGYDVRTNDLRMDVEPKARVYLLVAATNYTVNTTAASATYSNASNDIPSMEFDIINSYRTTV